MSDGYEVSVDEVRAHAATVAGISDEVGSARPSVQVGENSFGTIASFFASAITSAGNQVGDAITRGAQAVMGVQAGLGATAENYQRIEDATTQRFAVAGQGGDVVMAKLGGKPKPTPPGQRAKAVAVLTKISREKPISVATVALRPVRTAHNWVGDMASAEIGDHYERDAGELLRSLPTNANLRQMAETETAFWQSNRGNAIGAAMPADMRYSMLVSARDSWLNEFPPAERARIAQQLGLR